MEIYSSSITPYKINFGTALTHLFCTSCCLGEGTEQVKQFQSRQWVLGKECWKLFYFFHLFLCAIQIPYQPQCRKKVNLHYYNNSTVFDRCFFNSQLNEFGTVPCDRGQLVQKNWHVYHQAVFHESGLIHTACWDQ